MALGRSPVSKKTGRRGKIVNPETTDTPRPMRDGTPEGGKIGRDQLIVNWENRKERFLNISEK